MRISAEIVFSKCIAVEIAIASLIVISTALGYSSTVSLLFALSFAIIFIMGGCTIKSFPLVALTLGILSFTHVIFYGLKADVVFSFDYFKRVIMFVSFILLLSFSAQYGVQISQKTLELIQRMPLVAGIFLAASFFFLGNTHTWGGGGITLGFGNPNAAAMWLTHFVFYGILFVMEIKTHKSHAIFIPLIGLLFYLLFKTRARSSLLAIAVFVLLIVMRLLKIRIKNWMCALFSCFPIIFVFIYLNVIMTETIQKTLSFLVSEGKPLTARFFVWNTGLDIISEYPIFGNYIGLEEKIGFSHMHNTHLDVMCAYGAVPLLLFCYLLYVVLKRMAAEIESSYQYAAFASFVSIIIMGTFEASIVSGSMGMNLLTTGFVVLALSSPSKENVRDSKNEYLLCKNM